jgi:hypothetical protein
MSAFDSSGQPCYLTALHVSTKLSVWETSKQVTVPRCAWAVKAAGVESSVEILLQQLLWLDLGNNFKCRGENAAVNAFVRLLLEEQPNVIFHEVRPCSNVANTLDTWGCTAIPSSSSSASSSTSDKVIVGVGIGLDLELTLGDALKALEKARSETALYRALGRAASDLGHESRMSVLMTASDSFSDATQPPHWPQKTQEKANAPWVHANVKRQNHQHLLVS